MDRKTRAHIALFTVNLIYGANYAVAKALMPAVIGPSGFILIRVAGASLLFWAARTMLPQRVRIADMPRLFLCGFFGVAVNQLLFFHGLMRTSPLHASIIMVVTPILVLVMAGVLIGERITPMKVAGIALGATGAIALLLLGARAHDVGASSLGDLFILINAASFAVFLVIVKPLMARYSAVTVMAWAFLFGLLIVLPFGWKEGMAVNWSEFTAGTWTSVAFVVVAVTFAAYLLNTWALRHLDPSVVGTYIYFQPVMAIAFAWAYVHFGVDIPGAVLDPPHVGIGHMLCAAAIFAGVYLVGRRRKRT